MRVSGGSSTRAASIAERTSGQSSSAASSWASRADRRAVSRALTFGKQGQRAGQRRQVAGRGPAGGHPRGQPFQVVGLAQELAQIGPQAGITDQLLDGAGALGDQLERGQGRGEVIGQQPRPHRRDGAIDDLKQRAFALGLAQGSRQLQAAAGHLVQPQRVGLAIGGQPDDVPQRRLLGLAQVGHQGAGGLNLERAVVDAEAVQRGRAELLVAGSCGLARAESPTTGES